MTKKIRFLWHHHRAASLGFLAAFCITGFFILRMVVFTIYWADPAHRHQPPEGWMTPRYIAYSWQISPAEIAQTLNIPDTLGKRPNLQQIADARGVPLADVLAETAVLLNTPTVHK